MKKAIQVLTAAVLTLCFAVALAGCSSSEPVTAEQARGVNVHDYYEWSEALCVDELRLVDYLEACGVERPYCSVLYRYLDGEIGGHEFRMSWKYFGEGDDAYVLTDVRFTYGPNSDLYILGYIDDEVTPLKSPKNGMRACDQTYGRRDSFTLQQTTVEDLIKVLGSGNLLEATADDPLAGLGVTYKVVDHFGNATVHRA